ncbi:hypothetical protein [Mesorhizobium sp.]|uniref:hypothetical protein n=1 Tax=Mesorhizobium sp. TaxID=1871066 RepID=UPI00351A5203
MDDRCEALVRFVGPHGDAFELLELAEKVFDEVTPFVHLGVDVRGLRAARMLRDDDLGVALLVGRPICLFIDTLMRVECG